jgi:hypothetical protein
MKYNPKKLTIARRSEIKGALLKGFKPDFIERNLKTISCKTKSVTKKSIFGYRGVDKKYVAFY